MIAKSAQSILDVLNLMQGKAFLIFKPPVSNKEAQSLFKLWRSGNKDEYGRIRTPEDVDFYTVQSLADKRLVRCVDMRLANRRENLVEITEEGQKIIRDIILYAEKSSYEGGLDKINYEEIYQAAKFPGLKKAKASKTASTIQGHNWLQRICQ